jgi:hypothetical protein
MQRQIVDQLVENAGPSRLGLHFRYISRPSYAMGEPEVPLGYQAGEYAALALSETCVGEEIVTVLGKGALNVNPRNKS